MANIKRIKLDEPDLHINDERFHEYALKQIFRCLSFEDKIKCQFVCKKWNLLITDMLRNEQSSLIDSRNNQCDDHKEEFIGNNCVGRDIDLKLLKSILPKVPNLKCFRIDDKMKLDYIKFLVETCPRLECISINMKFQRCWDDNKIDAEARCYYFEKIGKLLTKVAIKTIIIRINEIVNCKWIDLLLKNLTVEKLRIENKNDYTLYRGKLTSDIKLKEIEFDGGKIALEIFNRNENVTKFKHLRPLRYTYVDYDSDDSDGYDDEYYIDKVITTFPNLIDLAMFLPYELDIPKINQLKNLKHLRKFSLSAKYLSFNISKFKDTFHNLTELRLDVHYIHSFKNLAYYLPNLQILGLIFPSMVDDHSIKLFLIQKLKDILEEVSKLIELKKFSIDFPNIPKEHSEVFIEFKCPPKLHQYTICGYNHLNIPLWMEFARKNPKIWFIVKVKNYQGIYVGNNFVIKSSNSFSFKTNI